jgi:hypothetical protein
MMEIIEAGGVYSLRPQRDHIHRHISKEYNNI